MKKVQGEVISKRETVKSIDLEEGNQPRCGVGVDKVYLGGRKSE